MLQARGKGIVLWTLRYGDEVRDPKEVFGDVEEKKAEPKLVTLVQKLIDDLQAPWDPALLADPVQERLKDISAGKLTTKPTKIGQEHVLNHVTTAQLICRLMTEQ